MLDINILYSSVELRVLYKCYYSLVVIVDNYYIDIFFL